MKLSLKAARVNAGLTLKQTAEKAGLTLQTIHNIESGKTKTNYRTLLKLCELYDMPIENIKLKEGE